VNGHLRKALLVVIDGLRPDAVSPATMPVLSDLFRRSWQAASAVTVRPSVTVAALTSLASGVPPAIHGLTEARLLHFPRLRHLRPLPSELRRVGVETTVITPALPGAARWLAGALLRLGGVTRLIADNSAPSALFETAARQLCGNSAREFVVVYVNDTDLAGHAWGWMSPAYLQAAAVIDRALAHILPFLNDPGILVAVTADHGGGGVLHNDHDHPHPVNDRIPLAFMGGRILPGAGHGEAPVSLLDVPPTVLHAFGGAVPGMYHGRVVHEAFATELVSV
jgi:Type I phosphodiesterase / nucleotide pyrophosphatase/Metalloenzyme superfamily